MAEVVDRNFLARLSRQALSELKLLRKELDEVRSLARQTVDHARRIERRVAESRKDIELMMKAEIGGRFAHFESRLDNRLTPLLDRLADLESR